MFTASYNESTSAWVFPKAQPTKTAQQAIDLKMALALDAKGDEYKAAGNFKMAKVCYARALKRAIKSGI
jgi:hypothetical protein